MKVLFDSNVILSAFTTQGMAQRAFRLALEHHDIFISQYIIDEVQRKLLKKFKFTLEASQSAAKYLRKVCTVVRTTGKAVPTSRDAKDDAILQAAVQAKVNFLVTGDNDLLVLEQRFSFRILNPRAFVESHVTG